MKVRIVMEVEVPRASARAYAKGVKISGVSDARKVAELIVWRAKGFEMDVTVLEVEECHEDAVASTQFHSMKGH